MLHYTICSMDRIKFYTLTFTVAILGGFIFGYDSEAIGGALLFIRKSFKMSAVSSDSLVSLALWTGLFAAISAGTLADKLGRKKVLWLSAIICAIGPIVSVFEQQYWDLDLGRALLGIGLGLNTVIIGLYTCEVAPPEYRGRLLALYPWAMTVGALVGDIVDILYAKSSDWRAMICLGAAPAILQAIGVYFLPESPVWLRARLAPQHRKPPYRLTSSEISMEAPTNPLTQEEMKNHSGWRELTIKSTRRAIIAVIGLAIMQQATGIVGLNYFAPLIFTHAGFLTPTTALVATLITSGLSVVMTLTVVGLVDKVGRKPLLVFGMASMFVALTATGVAFITLQGTPYLPWTTFVCLVLFNASYDLSVGSIIWILIPEILPTHIRAKGIAIALFLNWLTQAIMSQIFLSLTNTFTWGGAFLLFAAITVISIWFAQKNVDETSTKALPQDDLSKAL